MFSLLPVLRALSDATRLRIVLLLRRIELSVGEMVQILEQSQPRVSRHIGILEDAGLIEKHKEGSWVFLRPTLLLSSGAIAGLLNEMASDQLAGGDLQRLDQVRTARAELAENYFQAHAKEWDSLRSLHVAESDVETAMLRLLSAAPLGRVLDVGTGTGRIIELLAERADYICGLDKSGEMLRIARAKVAKLVPDRIAQDRVELMLGDFNRLPVEDASFDTVIFHQVLHYAPDARQAVGEAARVTAPGGRVLIVDFAAHDREELRELHAHARLGFGDGYINGLFNDAGLMPTQTETLDGDELAVKLWLASAPRASAAHHRFSPTLSTSELTQ